MSRRAAATGRPTPARPARRPPLAVFGPLLGIAALLWSAGAGPIAGPIVPQAAAADRPQAEQRGEAPTAGRDGHAVQWTDLFDGRTLRGWKVTQFGGEGDVYVEDGALVLDFGSSLTGVTYTGTLPRSNYEIRLEARRLDGTDFFCGLTFPVGSSHCTLIVGGWGGALVGLSSIDGKDASENDTQRTMAFKQGKWYPIRVRVTDDAIDVWIETKRVIHQPLSGRKVSLRPEVELSRPLGLCTWETRAAIRKLQLRQLDSGKNPPTGTVAD